MAPQTCPTNSVTVDATTNRITGTLYTYDANGDVTNDYSHAYSWDAEDRPVAIDSVGLTYDALGRMVEQNRSGAYTEIVYSPAGSKLALMNGPTLQKAFVPLPGQAQAVYTSTGLSYYRHPDSLGSSRLASLPTPAAPYSETAYAPFGEPYAQSGTTDLSLTGQNQDTVAGLYDFPAREYNTQGRWISPDPAGIKAATLTDPRSLNQYAYVSNTPLNATDPLGLRMCLSVNESGMCDITGTARFNFLPIILRDGCNIDVFHDVWGDWLYGGFGGFGFDPFGDGPPWALVHCTCLLTGNAFGFGPPIQGFGCAYICACDDGIAIAVHPPNFSRRCRFVPCPPLVSAFFHKGSIIFDEAVMISPPFCE